MDGNGSDIRVVSVHHESGSATRLGAAIVAVTGIGELPVTVAGVAQLRWLEWEAAALLRRPRLSCREWRLLHDMQGAIRAALELAAPELFRGSLELLRPRTAP
jgi:hypothetical protein